MLRDKSLVPLSHQHQHALALCVRIQHAIRAGDIAFAVWQGEINHIFEREIEIHFEAEELILFPIAAQYHQVRVLISQLLAEHTELRSYRLAALARSMGRSDLVDFASTLSNHIRKEEQELFEALQRMLTEDQLSTAGARIIEFFQSRGLSGEAGMGNRKG